MKSRRNIRLPYWDYSAEGYYFVTICTKDRECLFGEIVNGEMVLNEIGMVVCRELEKTQKMRENVSIDVFCIMPNHVHLVILIGRPVGAYCNTPLQLENLVEKRSFKSPSQSLGSVVRGFKSAVKKYATIKGINLTWQRGYYDRVIRNEKELGAIREYILRNPEKWQYDSENIF